MITYESTESNSIGVNVMISEDYKMYSIIKVRVQVLLDYKIVTSLDIDMKSCNFSVDVVTDLMVETYYTLYDVHFIKSTTNVIYERKK